MSLKYHLSALKSQVQLGLFTQHAKLYISMGQRVWGAELLLHLTLKKCGVTGIPLAKFKGN